MPPSKSLDLFIQYSLNTVLWIIAFGFLIFLLRVPLKCILNAIAHIGTYAKNIHFKGVKIDLGSSTLLNEQNQDYYKLLNNFQSMLVAADKENIRKQLSDSKLTSDQTIEILIDTLANYHLIVALMSVDLSSLFPEQIELLMYPNNHMSASESKINIYYDKFIERLNKERENKKQSNDEPNYLFESFIGHMLKQQLVIRTTDGWGITNLGKEYVIFLAKTGRIPLRQY